MGIEQKTDEVFEIFTVAKESLNRFLLEGIGAIGADGYIKIQELCQKLTNMNLSYVAEHLDKFLNVIRKIHDSPNQKKELKSIAVETMFKTILVNRTFDRVLNLELARKHLLENGDIDGSTES
nr:hypothetical protein [Candidatus Sigynarchaeota archaeon]